MVVPKKDGKVHFYVDYRQLSAVTVRETDPLPEMGKCTDSLKEETTSVTWELDADVQI